jgi:hypothetical protein
MRAFRLIALALAAVFVPTAARAVEDGNVTSRQVRTRVR